MPPRHVLSFGRVFARVHDGGSCVCMCSCAVGSSRQCRGGAVFSVWAASQIVGTTEKPPVYARFCMLCTCVWVQKLIKHETRVSFLRFCLRRIAFSRSSRHSHGSCNAPRCNCLAYECAVPLDSIFRKYVYCADE